MRDYQITRTTSTLTHSYEKMREEISMDFITRLTKSKGKDVTLVVVNKFTKYVHFCIIQSNFIANQGTKAFLEEVNALPSFCNLQQLIVNLGKTKVIIFNASYHNIADYRFYFRGEDRDHYHLHLLGGLAHKATF